jgi:hypothetical protein
MELYKFQTEVLALDRDLFSTPITELLTLVPPGEITNWIASRRPIILQSQRDSRHRSTSSVQLLSTYFHPLHRKPSFPVCHPRRRRSHASQDSTTCKDPPLDDDHDTLITEHFPRLSVQTIATASCANSLCSLVLTIQPSHSLVIQFTLTPVGLPVRLRRGQDSFLT